MQNQEIPAKLQTLHLYMYAEGSDMATTGTGTKEYLVIKRHYAALVDTLGSTVDPAGFARRLGEKSLISTGEL